MGREWRCKDCGKLLGVMEGANLILRYKEMEVVVTEGRITAVCPKCHRISLICVGERLQKMA